MRHNHHHWSCLAIGTDFVFEPNDGEDIEAALRRARKIATRMQTRHNRYFHVALVDGRIIVGGVAKGHHLANRRWDEAQIGQYFEMANLGATCLKKVREKIRYWRRKYNRDFVAEVCGPLIRVSRTG